MRPLILLLLSLFAATPALACDPGNVCTTFTLGAPTANCISVTSQDGVATTSGAYCPSGFFGGGGLAFWLPNDPADPGNSLTMYSCAVTQVGDTNPDKATVGATRTITDSLTCPGVNQSYFTSDWNGSVAFNYVGVSHRSCSSGRGAHCVTSIIWAQTDGSGQLSTPTPPPAPPPPPQPVEYDLIVDTVTPYQTMCDVNLTCVFAFTDTSVVQLGELIPLANEFVLVNADGSLDYVNLDYLSTSQVGDDQPEPGSDDPVSYVLNGSGEVYDPNTGLQTKEVSVTLNVTVDYHGNVALTSGTTTVVVLPPQ